MDNLMTKEEFKELFVKEILDTGVYENPDHPLMKLFIYTQHLSLRLVAHEMTTEIIRLACVEHLSEVSYKELSEKIAKKLIEQITQENVMGRAEKTGMNLEDIIREISQKEGQDDK